MKPTLYLVLLWLCCQIKVTYADCAADMYGEMICGMGKCERDQYGTVFCSRFNNGGAVRDGYGNVYCGVGDCARDQYGKVYCSKVVGGGAARRIFLITVTEVVERQLKYALNLMGIQVPDKM